jgi:hypothetical protein
MSVYRFIFWRNDTPKENGMRFANVHLLVGYNQGAITDYQEMAAEMRKTFPQALDGVVYCGKVIKSTYCDSFTLLRFDAYIPEGDYPEWRQVEKGVPDYYWV